MDLKGGKRLRRRRRLQSHPGKPIHLLPGVRRAAFALLLFILTACRANSDVAVAPVAPPANQTNPTPVLRPQSLSFDSLNLAAGLSQSGIYSIAQDAQGFLWLATEDGLNRYDGYSFAVFRPQPNDPTSLTDGFVQTLLVDHNDQLWIGTNRGLDRYDARSEVFVHFESSTRLSTVDVLSLFESNDGRLWVGTHGDGLYLLDQQSGLIEHIAVADNALLLNVQAIVQDGQGKLWVGADQGLYRLDATSNRLAAVAQGDIHALCLDKDGQLWIGSTEGVTVIDPGADPVLVRQSLRHDPAEPGTLTAGEVRTIYADRSGTIWIGTTGGLNRVGATGQQITRYEHDPTDDTTLGVPYVRSIFEDREGNLWVGTYGGGLARAAPNTKQFRHLLAGYGVTGMAEAPPGTLWAGTLDDGLFRIDLNSEQVEHFTLNPDEPGSLISNHIWDIVIDQQSSLWIGTVGGLSRLDPPYDTFTHYRHHPDDDQSLSHNHVWTLLSDRSGALWIGTEAGLDRFNSTTETFYHQN